MLLKVSFCETLMDRLCCKLDVLFTILSCFFVSDQSPSQSGSESDSITESETESEEEDDGEVEEEV